jgi:hypothetical protein
MSVAGARAEAQAFFDQGVRLLYGFNHDEAGVPSARRRGSTLAWPWRTGAKP